MIKVLALHAFKNSWDGQSRLLSIWFLINLQRFLEQSAISLETPWSNLLTVLRATLGTRGTRSLRHYKTRWSRKMWHTWHSGKSSLYCGEMRLQGRGACVWPMIGSIGRTELDCVTSLSFTHCWRVGRLSSPNAPILRQMLTPVSALLVAGNTHSVTTFVWRGEFTGCADYTLVPPSFRFVPLLFLTPLSPPPLQEQAALKCVWGKVFCFFLLFSFFYFLVSVFFLFCFFSFCCCAERLL